MFEQLAEGALAAEVEVQGAHANAHGQRALAGDALKAAFGRLAPGSVQMLQGVDAEAGGNG